MLIKAYGLHWDPEEIYGINGQSSKVSFRGFVKKRNKKYEIDFWNAKGIYALFKDFEIFYIGKVTENRLGKRIESHWRYRKEHWDTFSFYSFSDIDFKKEKVKPTSKKIEIDINVAIKTIEAIIINTAVPFNNKQETRFPNSHKVTQKPFIVRNTINDVIDRLEYLENKLFPPNRKKINK